jgi:hypothetical protein
MGRYIVPSLSLIGGRMRVVALIEVGVLPPGRHDRLGSNRGRAQRSAIRVGPQWGPM